MARGRRNANGNGRRLTSPQSVNAAVKAIARGLLDGSGVPPGTLSPEAIHRLIDRALVEPRASISPRFDVPVIPRPSSPR